MTELIRDCSLGCFGNLYNDKYWLVWYKKSTTILQKLFFLLHSFMLLKASQMQAMP